MTHHGHPVTSNGDILRDHLHRGGDRFQKLSGISNEYYLRLERGRDRNPSVQVLQSLLNDTDGIMLVIYHPEPGTASADKLALLASAALTAEQAPTRSTAPRRP